MFSNACKYGIRAALYLAAHEPGRKSGVKEIASQLNVPAPFLAKLLQQLAKEGVISSIKGPGGGFFMSPANLNGSLSEVINCIDGLDPLNACILGLPACSHKHPCPLHAQAFAYRQGLKFQLEHQTIKDLAQSVKKEGLHF
ncbi:MAG TPA: Rrf2 family transcriptional regulator [Flavilitoribacter sp.]|nr:Rrf2 family transcriptional regulator [Flavilitoribacter sp.]HMQ89279.1 Rrf2 family transcriptional regulator [Flavilitoribacter sp.]